MDISAQPEVFFDTSLRFESFTAPSFTFVNPKISACRNHGPTTIRTSGTLKTLPELSNFYCLPGRAGGSPFPTRCTTPLAVRIDTARQHIKCSAQLVRFGRYRKKSKSSSAKRS
jgi:hypothetical protein